MGSKPEYLVWAPLSLPFAALMRTLYLHNEGDSVAERLRAANVPWFALVIAVVVFSGTRWLIPAIAAYVRRAGLGGYDLNKGIKGKEQEKIPEPLGIVPGVLFLIGVIMIQSQRTLVSPDMDSNDGASYNASLHSVCFMLLLGFVDDVLDVPWRYKLVLPFFASLPLITAYSGPTAVVLPTFARGFFGLKVLEMGVFYRCYMALLSVFCTNCINIYAGINGLEAGQSLVVACTILAHNLTEHGYGPHAFSASIMLPFIGCVLGLLCHNWHPSRVFVGDTFTYFAGMVLSVSGILGHFSKTLMLFFFPQVLNFVLSLPQLLKIVPCPRHRLPKYDEDTGLLVGNPSHLNVVNQVLVFAGPMSERALCVLLLAFQLLCSFVALYVRYPIAEMLFH